MLKLPIPTPASWLKASELYDIALWVMQYPALTLMVFLRRDLGYRLLNPFKLFTVFGLLAVLAILATQESGEGSPTAVLIFCGIGFLNGIAQRLRRWHETNQGVVRHSYTIGNSPFNFPWLPHFFRRNRRMARYADPLFCAAIGIILFPHFRGFGLYLVFAAFCLKGFEVQVFMRERNRNLDLVDAILTGESQTHELEQVQSEPIIQPTQSNAGIPTGMGSDVEQNIRQNKQGRATRRS